MNSVSYFEIQAENPERAVKFYTGVFGWRFKKDTNIQVEYWRIETDGSRGGLLKRPNQTPPPEFGTNAFVCSIEVAHFDETSDKIIESGGVVALEKFAVPGKCWQGYFIDTEGNTFGLFQGDLNAQ